MDWLLNTAPWLVAMGALVAGSAFFSSSEAALFYLRRQDRRVLQVGNPAQRIAASLLDDPDRLLTAVLFWNLVTNITYFAIVSILSIRLERQGLSGQAALFSFGSLVGMIFFSEMLPKSAAVLRSRWVAAAVAIPLATSVRLLDPLIASFRFVNLLSRRLLFPEIKPEKALHLVDLQRAIEFSTTDPTLIEQERSVLQNVIALSDARVDELMRPRVQFVAFRPPVSLSDLKGELTPSGYLLVTEPESDEIAGAIPLKYLSEIPNEHLEHLAESVCYVPWCATGAEALEVMRRFDREVAVVVNEYGETVGIVTFDDLLDTMFGYQSSRSARMLRTSPIEQIESNRWQVTGMTSLRRFVRYFDMTPPPTRAVTVAGVVQEALQRVPVRGDSCHWGPFRFEVLDAPERGQLTLRVERRATDEQPSGQEDSS